MPSGEKAWLQEASEEEAGTGAEQAGRCEARGVLKGRTSGGKYA